MRKQNTEILVCNNLLLRLEVKSVEKFIKISYDN